MESMDPFDVKFAFDTDICKDTVRNLDRFALLSRTGRCKDAESLYQEHLQYHEYWFAVVQEYVLHLQRLYVLPRLRDYVDCIERQATVYPGRGASILQDWTGFARRALQDKTGIHDDELAGDLSRILGLLRRNPKKHGNRDVSTVLKQLHCIHNLQRYHLNNMSLLRFVVPIPRSSHC